MKNICIREYGILFPEPSNLAESLNQRVISKKDWDWLLEEVSGNERHKPLVRPIKRYGYIGLQVLNYVGVVSTPYDCQIEIVPKIDKYSIVDNDDVEQNKEAEKSRRKLIQMLSSIGIFKFREFNQASLKELRKPLHEVLINQFLNTVSVLIKRGIRNDYVPVRGEEPFLKGRLQVAEQIRKPVGRQHLFLIEYDEFIPDRAENRLIHSALVKVSKQSKDSENLRLANEFLFVFGDIPLSNNYQLDFSRWLDRDRTMVHYRPVKEWCEFILNDKSPYSLAGAHHGISYLFPMNTLFEKYVATTLGRKLDKSFQLQEQASSEFLVEQYRDNDRQKMFKLKPDIIIQQGNSVVSVLDAKWKLLNSAASENKFGISQGDMYQLFAYGQKYMKGTGEMFLIYPESETFNKPLPVFSFDKNLKLWVVPFVWGNDTLSMDYVDFGSAETAKKFIAVD